MAGMAPRWLVVALALAIAVSSSVACTENEVREDRCERVKSQLDACAGTSFGRLDCSEVTSADLDRLDDVSQGLACQALSGVAPIDGDPMSATCRLLGVGCVAAVTPAPRRTPTRDPVVLVNGIDTSPLFRYSDRIVSTMRSEGGHRVFLATLTPYEPPTVRAPELWTRIEEIRKETGAARVNLVCHSLGGLDCRYLVSPGGLAADLGVAPDTMARAVASITTIGTAHQGTRVADVALGLAPDGDAGAILDHLGALSGDAFRDRPLERGVHARAALRALSVAAAPAFNAEIRDAEGVFYQSWAGYSRPFGVADGAHDQALAELCTLADGSSGLPAKGGHDYLALPLLPIADVVGTTESSSVRLPNDGLVTVASAKWGVFRGCIPADHIEQLGQKSLPDVNVRTGFDVARFYANVAGDLAERGF